MKNLSVAQAVWVGGTIGGALDLAFALSFAAWNGLAPTGLLQLIASGLLGRQAIGAGAWTAVLGLVLHFLMSWLWAALYAAAALHAPRLRARPVVAGCAFGIVVFLCMRLGVKPLSAFPFPVTWKPLSSILDLLSHMLLFGTPIALAAARVRQSLAGPAPVR